VQKFGGTSVQDAEAMLRVMDIVHAHGITRSTRPLVVLSAAAGVTNQLIRISELSLKAKTNDALAEIAALAARHERIARDLIESPRALQPLLLVLSSIWTELRTLVRGVNLLRELTPKSRDQFQSVGERCSTLIFATAFGERLRDEKIAIQLFDSRDFFTTSREFTQA